MILLFSAMACAADSLVTVDVDGTERSAYVHVPDGLAANAPLVLMFHGGGPGGAHKGRRVGAFTGFDDLADARGFAVAYPNSVNGNWDDRRVQAEIGGHPTDLALVGALIDELVATHRVDRSRVYAAGISNGGFFVQRVGCETTLVKAIAPVVAGLAPALQTTCTGEPLPVLAIVGTADPLVPYEGGQVARDRGETLSSDASLAVWSARNGCGAVPVSVELADVDMADGTRSRRETWPDCGALTERIVVTGGGHTWPGAAQYLPERWIGLVLGDCDATMVIADFFGL